MIKRNQTFKKLKLVVSQEEVTRNTLSLLAEAATGHASLEEFHFDIRDCLCQDNVEPVGDMLATNTNLRTAAFKDCAGLEGEGDLVSQVCRGLKSKVCALKELDLSRNCIGRDGSFVLSEALRHKDSVEKVCLYDNEVENSGARLLAQALTSNHHIVDLDLSFNNIGGAGANALADALRSNCGLQKLTVSFNPIDSGIVDIADALPFNTNLKELRALCIETSTEIGLNSFPAFLKNLPTMSVKHLEFCANETVSSQDAANFLLATERNTSLEHLNIVGSEHLTNIMPKVELYLKLNKAGRARALTPNVPSLLWPRILAKSSNDADILYFFIRENPPLFKKQTHLGKRKRGA